MLNYVKGEKKSRFHHYAMDGGGGPLASDLSTVVGKTVVSLSHVVSKKGPH